MCENATAVTSSTQETCRDEPVTAVNDDVVQDGVVPQVPGAGLEEPWGQRSLGGGGGHPGGAGVVDFHVLVGGGAGVAKHLRVDRHRAATLAVTPATQVG